MKALLFVISMLLATSLQAQQSVCSNEWTSKADLDCIIGSRGENAHCLATRAGEASAEMNRLTDVMKSDLVKPVDLLGAQRAWDRYRNAECNFEASGAACEPGEAGILCSPTVARCHVRLTCERVQLLREQMGNICTDCPPRKSAGQ